MATTINEANIVKLLDGTEISVRPLKISLLRDFMKHYDTISEVAEDNDKSIDVMLQCVQIALKQFKPELATDIKALEELLDLPTIWDIINGAQGLKTDEAALLNAVN